MTKHGGKGTRLYKIWDGMKQRCYNPNHVHFSHYGGREIVVCDEWVNDFATFLDWANTNGYDDRLMIDRVDNDGNYSPDNCQFVDIKTQNNNKRTNIRLRYCGRTYTCSELAEVAGINYQVFWSRIKSGWNVQRAVETPVAKRTKRSSQCE